MMKLYNKNKNNFRYKSIPREIDNFFYKISLLILILCKINIIIIYNILHITCKGLWNKYISKLFTGLRLRRHSSWGTRRSLPSLASHSFVSPTQTNSCGVRLRTYKQTDTGLYGALDAHRALPDPSTWIV